MTYQKSINQSNKQFVVLLIKAGEEKKKKENLKKQRDFPLERNFHCLYRKIPWYGYAVSDFTWVYKRSELISQLNWTAKLAVQS